METFSIDFLVVKEGESVFKTELFFVKTTSNAANYIFLVLILLILYVFVFSLNQGTLFCFAQVELGLVFWLS